MTTPLRVALVTSGHFMAEAVTLSPGGSLTGTAGGFRLHDSQLDDSEQDDGREVQR